MRFTSDEQRKAVMARMHYGPALATGIGVGLGARAYLRRKALPLSKEARQKLKEVQFLRSGIKKVPAPAAHDIGVRVTEIEEKVVRPLLKQSRRYRHAGKYAVIGSALIGYGASRAIAQRRKRQAIASVDFEDDYAVQLPYHAPVVPVQSQPLYYAGPTNYARYMNPVVKARILRSIDKLHGIQAPGEQNGLPV